MTWETKVKRVARLVVLALFAGCATTPDGMRQVTSSDKVVYRIHADDVDSKGSFWGVSFAPRPYEYTRSGFRYHRTARIVARTDDRCEVTFDSVITQVSGKRNNPEPLTSSKTYLFEVEKSKKRGVARVEFRPLFEAVGPEPDFGSRKVSPPDTVENALELLATSGELLFRFEADAGHDADTILASFRKYCREKSHPQNPVQIGDQSFKTSYLLLSGDRTLATFYLSLAEKGDGTRASIIARIPLAPDGSYQVDAVQQAADMKKVVLEILKEKDR